MKKHPNKTFLSLFIIMLVSACHTLNHNGFKLIETNKKLIIEAIENKDIKSNDIDLSSKVIDLKKNTKNKVLEKLNKTPKLLPKKNLNKPVMKKFNLISILKLSEPKLFKELGKSDFVKFEGKLKNHQYYFSKCFLDVFFIKKESHYYVDFVQTRPTKLNGTLDKEECLENINKKISVLKR